MPHAFDRILASSFFPVYRGGDPAAHRAACDAHAAGLARIGTTHVMVNHAPLSVYEVMEPTNSYMRFTTHGPTADKFVESDLSRGTWHPSVLAQNREYLQMQAEEAKRAGLRAFVRCVEPCLMPEEFFRRHPRLRGPRVDNPVCSSEPRFAMCTAMPEVQEHYRQVAQRLLELCPLIDEMHIFTNDSGAGFCYSQFLYAGPNGAGHCKHLSAGDHARLFCAALLEGGRRVNPDFRVVMTSGLAPAEKDVLLTGAPAGVASAIYGAFAWGGGLEARWQNLAEGPAIHRDPALRRRAQDWALADMRARAQAVTAKGGLAYACYNPDYYSGPSDVAAPWQTHRCLMTYLDLGVKSLIGGAWTDPWHANSAIYRRVRDCGTEDTEAAVLALATEWVGEAFAPRLIEAWRQTELSDVEAPMPADHGHSWWCEPTIASHPIVPDDGRLGPKDLDYYLTPVIRDQQLMTSHQGGAWRFCHTADTTKQAIVEQATTVAIPAAAKAIALLDTLLAEPGLTGDARACIAVQRREAVIQHSYLRRVRNWHAASFHRLEGSTPYPGCPTLAASIDDEIDATRAWNRALGQPADNERVHLMLAHREDPTQRIDLRRHPLKVHKGCDAWPGAHLAAKS
jgi:hypothetical protein